MVPNASTPVRRFVGRPALRQAFPVSLEGAPNLHRASSSDIWGFTISLFLYSKSFFRKLSISSAFARDEDDDIATVATKDGNAEKTDRREHFFWFFIPRCRSYFSNKAVLDGDVNAVDNITDVDKKQAVTAATI